MEKNLFNGPYVKPAIKAIYFTTHKVICASGLEDYKKGSSIIFEEE